MVWSIKKHIVTSIAVVLINIIAEYAAKYILILGIARDSVFTSNSAMSVAIIGGSDGPTAIYHSDIYGSISVWAGHVVFLIVLLLTYWPFKRLMMGSRVE